MAAKKKSARDTGSGKPRRDKLGIKGGELVHLAGPFDASVRDDLTSLGAKTTKSVSDAHWILWPLAGPDDLAVLAALRKHMQPTAAIWAVWPKGRAELKEDHIRDFALTIDLVDVKVMSWSDTHSGLKLYVRKEKR